MWIISHFFQKTSIALKIKEAYVWLVCTPVLLVLSWPLIAIGLVPLNWAVIATYIAFPAVSFTFSAFVWQYVRELRLLLKEVRIHQDATPDETPPFLISNQYGPYAPSCPADVTLADVDDLPPRYSFVEGNTSNTFDPPKYSELPWNFLLIPEIMSHEGLEWVPPVRGTVSTLV